MTITVIIASVVESNEVYIVTTTIYCVNTLY